MLSPYWESQLIKVLIFSFSFQILPINFISPEPYLLVMEYVMYGKLLTHLRDQRSKQTSLFHFTEEDLQQPSEDSNITAKDLTKYAYGVAKGMEYIVSKNVSVNVKTTDVSS